MPERSRLFVMVTLFVLVCMVFAAANRKIASRIIPGGAVSSQGAPER